MGYETTDDIVNNLLQNTIIDTEVDDIANANTPDMSNIDNQISQIYNEIDTISKLNTIDYDRDKELKDNERYRHIANEDLQKDWFSDELETDSDLSLAFKTGINAISSGIDWLLEASENVADFGQGDWLNNAKIDAVYKGKDYNMSNKAFFRAKDKTAYDVREELLNAPEDPNARHTFYALKKFDGYDENGKEKFLYKYGIAKDGYYKRYIDQFVKDGFTPIFEKRIANAETIENTLHATEDALNNRALDLGKVKVDGKYISTDKASQVGFGAGYTELYNKDILGLDGLMNTQNVESASKVMYNEALKRPTNSGIVDALQAGAVGLATNLADFGVNKILHLNSQKLKEMSSQEWIDNFVGYDRTNSQADLTEAYYAMKRGDYGSMAINALSAAPETLAESAPDMALFMIDAPLGASMKLASNANKINKAIKLGQISAKEAELAKLSLIDNAVKSGISKAKAKSIINAPEKVSFINQAIKSNAGLAHSHVANVNRVLNDRIEAKKEAGEDPTLSVGEIAGVTVGLLPFTMLDKFMDTSILRNNQISKAVSESLDYVPESKLGALALGITKAAGHLAEASGEEAAQEYLQTWGEILNSNTGINKQTILDVLNNADNQKEAAMAAIAGAGSGSLMKMYGVSTDNKYANKLKEIIRNTGGSITDYMTGNTTKKNDAIFANAKTLDELDEVADNLGGTFTAKLAEEIIKKDNEDKNKDSILYHATTNPEVFNAFVDKAVRKTYGENLTKKQEEQYKQDFINNLVFNLFKANTDNIMNIAGGEGDYNLWHTAAKTAIGKKQEELYDSNDKSLTNILNFLSMLENSGIKYDIEPVRAYLKSIAKQNQSDTISDIDAFKQSKEYLEANEDEKEKLLNNYREQKLKEFKLKNSAIKKASGVFSSDDFIKELNSLEAEIDNIFSKKSDSTVKENILNGYIFINKDGKRIRKAGIKDYISDAKLITSPQAALNTIKGGNNTADASANLYNLTNFALSRKNKLKTKADEGVSHFGKIKDYNKANNSFLTTNLKDNALIEQSLLKYKQQLQKYESKLKEEDSEDYYKAINAIDTALIDLKNTNETINKLIDFNKSVASQIGSNSNYIHSSIDENGEPIVILGTNTNRTKYYNKYSTNDSKEILIKKIAQELKIAPKQVLALTNLNNVKVIATDNGVSKLIDLNELLNNNNLNHERTNKNDSVNENSALNTDTQNNNNKGSESSLEDKTPSSHIINKKEKTPEQESKVNTKDINDLFNNSFLNDEEQTNDEIKKTSKITINIDNNIKENDTKVKENKQKQTTKTTSSLKDYDKYKYNQLYNKSKTKIIKDELIKLLKLYKENKNNIEYKDTKKRLDELSLDIIKEIQEFDKQKERFERIQEQKKIVQNKSKLKSLEDKVRQSLNNIFKRLNKLLKRFKKKILTAYADSEIAKDFRKQFENIEELLNDENAFNDYINKLENEFYIQTEVANRVLKGKSNFSNTKVKADNIRKQQEDKIIKEFEDNIDNFYNSFKNKKIDPNAFVKKYNELKEYMKKKGC